MKQGKIHKNPTDPIDLRVYFGQEYLGELYEKINRPALIASQFEIHLRVLNAWMNKLDEKKTQFRQRYSFVNYTFFKMVEQLRELEVGLSLVKSFKEHVLTPQKVKGVFSKIEHTSLILENSKLSAKEKEHLLNLLHSQEPKKEIDQQNFTWLHLFVMYWIYYRKPVNIAIFNDGSFILLDEKTKQIGKRNFIRISVSEIMRNFLYSDLSTDLLSELEFLSNAENKIFKVVEKRNYQRITVFYEGHTSTSTLEKKKEIKEEIADKITEHKISGFEIQNRKGEAFMLDYKTTVLL